jgi:hypothetical protein
MEPKDDHAATLGGVSSFARVAKRRLDAVVWLFDVG